jgi:hypothetical protein
MTRTSLRITAALAMLAGVAACAHRGVSSVAPPPAKAIAPAAASSAAACPACTADPTRYLRQLSLDLRGRPPSFEELEDVDKRGEVTPQMIDAMLRSDEFIEQVEGYLKPELRTGGLPRKA